MPFYHVEFEKQIEVVVEAESLAEAQKAADEIGDWELDNDWDGEWVRHVYSAGTRHQKSFDMGVIDGEFLDQADYAAKLAERAAKEAEKAAKAPYVCDPNQLSLPLGESIRKSSP